jgi:hypothetical protein
MGFKLVINKNKIFFRDDWAATSIPNMVNNLKEEILYF